MQPDSYYPYGLPSRGGNRYRYGGKELTTLKGLNLYDFAARTYVPDLGRFMQPDPSTHDYHWLSPYAYCGGDPVNFIDPTGEDFWHTTDISEITKFFNAVLGGNNFYDFSGWTHMSDIEFLNSLVYDDKAYKLYATTTSVVEGELIVNCAIYNIRIYPVISFRRQVHEPVNGLLDEICYALSPWTYFDGVTNWKVGKDGYISGIAPISLHIPEEMLPIGRVKIGRAIGKMSGNRAVQFEQVELLAKKHKLTKDQREQLHRYIGHEGYGYHEIEEAIFDLFGK